jgi:hypothetical protein
MSKVFIIINILNTFLHLKTSFTINSDIFFLVNMVLYNVENCLINIETHNIIFYISGDGFCVKKCISTNIYIIAAKIQIKIPKNFILF